MILWFGLFILGIAMLLLMINHESGLVGGMASTDFASLAQYTAITVLIGAGVLGAYRHRIRQGLRDALTWVMIALVLVAVYGFRHDIFRLGNQIVAVLIPGFPVNGVSSDGTHTVTLRQRDDGHFVAVAHVNGVAVDMIVDSGASLVVLRANDADEVGIRLVSLDYSARVSTANGMTMAAPVRLQSVTVGDLQFSNIPALVAQPGALKESLLGNSFLERLVSYEVRADTLVLRGQP